MNRGTFPQVFCGQLVEIAFSRGIVLCGAMGAMQGIPYMANESGAKSYVQSFGEALHVELNSVGVNVTVLVVGPTQTAIIEKFGLDPTTMPMKPMSVEQCVFEGLEALKKNRATVLPGRVNRMMNALIPTSLSRKMMARTLTARARSATTRTPPLNGGGIYQLGLQ